MTSPLYIIGLAGYKQSGKDTAAEMLKKEFRVISSHRIGFADAGKEECARILGCSLESLESKKSEPLVRHIFQWYLTDFMKEKHGNDVWLRKMAEAINVLRNTKPLLIVIPDVRFQMESNWIHEMGGFVIKLERYDSSDDMHVSEQEVSKINGDFTLRNKGSLNDLQREVKWISQFLKEKWKMV